jgi:hypothetical protein
MISLEELIASKRVSSIPTANSQVQILDTLKAIHSLYEVEELRDVAEASIVGKSLIIPASFVLTLNQKGDGRSVDLRPVLSLGAAVRQSTQIHLGISEEAATTLATYAQKAASEALNLPWGAVKKALRLPTPSQEKLRSAALEIFDRIEINHDYDVLGLAGYSELSARKVYIDRGLPRYLRLRDGREIDSFLFLGVHEAVEKSLLLFLNLSEKSYYRTHQIAQQLEKFVIQAFGYPWKEYQYEQMIPHILRVDLSLQVSLPPDLDLTPQDEYAVGRIDEALQLKWRNAIYKGKFKAYRLAPLILHIQFKKRKDLASSFMRFQESYESPHFKGQSFTRAEFLDWHKNTYIGADYFVWDGFNFPATALSAFAAGDFDPLTSEETNLFQFMKSNSNDLTYIIGTADDSERDTLFHELSHALWYLSPAYREEVREVLSTIDVQPIEALLKSELGMYHESVMEDEIQAWLTHNYDYLGKDGLTGKTYRKASILLRRIFYRHIEAVLMYQAL